MFIMIYRYGSGSKSDCVPNSNHVGIPTKDIKIWRSICVLAASDFYVFYKKKKNDIYGWTSGCVTLRTIQTKWGDRTSNLEGKLFCDLRI